MSGKIFLENGVDLTTPGHSSRVRRVRIEESPSTRSPIVMRRTRRSVARSTTPLSFGRRCLQSKPMAPAASMEDRRPAATRPAGRRNVWRPLERDGNGWRTTDGSSIVGGAALQAAGEHCERRVLPLFVASAVQRTAGAKGLRNVRIQHRRREHRSSMERPSGPGMQLTDSPT